MTIESKSSRVPNKVHGFLYVQAVYFLTANFKQMRNTFMKKILTYLKRSQVPMIVDNELLCGSFPATTITIAGKKKTAVITQSIFTCDNIEVSIETPRSSTPYAHKSFTSEQKALNYLFNEGIFQS
jgi:hypothetical protein